MINLLGSNDRRQLRAARRNTVWLQYVSILVIALIAMNILSFSVVWALALQEVNSKTAIEKEQSGQGIEYVKAKREIEEFRNNLNAAKIILGGETAYSDVILDIADVLPKNVVVSSLTLNPQLFGTLQNFSFKVKSNQDAIGLKTALENSDGLFSNVSVVTITASQSSTDEYPVSVTVAAILKKPTSAQQVATGSTL